MNLDSTGFAIVPSVFAPVECASLVDALAAAPRSRAGARHLLADPHAARVARDPRLLRIARKILGAGAVPFRATLFEKPAASNWLVVWHQDTALPVVERFEAPGWGPWSVKQGIVYAHAPAWALARVVALRLHLDASLADNGPLRVLPGTHRLGVLSDEEVASRARDAEATECVCGQGAVLAMRPLLIHASSKASATASSTAAAPEPRRVLHIEYADGLTLAPGVTLAVA